MPRGSRALVFRHLYLPDPSFNFDTVIGPVPLESRATMAAAMKGHVIAPLGKFNCNLDVDPAAAKPSGGE